MADAAAPVADVVRSLLLDGARRLTDTGPGVATGADDAVHQVRVGCRRLRSNLRAFRAVVDQRQVRPLRRELQWLADALGSARDLEVLRVRFAATAAADPVAPLDPGLLADLDAMLAARAAAAQEEARAAVTSDRCTALVAALTLAADDLPLKDSAQRATVDVLPAMVAKTWRRLARDARRLHRDGPDADWHRVRIRAKQARYCAEAVAPVRDGPIGAAAKAAKKLQTILGEHQDAAVAAETALAAASERPDDTAFGILLGRLAERERAAVRVARQRFLERWEDVDDSTEIRELLGR